MWSSQLKNSNKKNNSIRLIDKLCSRKQRKIYWHVTVTCQQYEKCLLTCDRYMAAPYPTASGYWHAGLPRYIACISNNNNVFVLHTLLLVLTSAMASQEEVLSCIFVGKVFENYKEVEDLIVNLREVCYYGVKYKERRTSVSHNKNVSVTVLILTAWIAINFCCVAESS